MYNVPYCVRIVHTLCNVHTSTHPRTQLLHPPLLCVHLLDAVVLGKLVHHLPSELLLLLPLSRCLACLELLVVLVCRLQLQTLPQLSLYPSLGGGRGERGRGGGGGERGGLELCLGEVSVLTFSCCLSLSICSSMCSSVMILQTQTNEKKSTLYFIQPLHTCTARKCYVKYKRTMYSGSMNMKTKKYV